MENKTNSGLETVLLGLKKINEHKGKITKDIFAVSTVLYGAAVTFLGVYNLTNINSDISEEGKLLPIGVGLGSMIIGLSLAYLNNLPFEKDLVKNKDYNRVVRK